MNRPGKVLALEIEKGRRFYDLFGAVCLKDPELGRLLNCLREQIRKTDAEMLKSGVVEACTRCAKATGSCCFREMGESFGSIDLFINLLLGSKIPAHAEFPESCLFVGQKGCMLQARQSFCLNYFCPELKQSLGKAEILRIQLQAGEQLGAGWELERTLTRYLENAHRQDQTGNTYS